MRQITHFILQAQEIQCCTPSRVRCIHALRVYAEVAGFVGLQGEQKQQRAPWLFFFPSNAFVAFARSFNMPVSQLHMSKFD